MVSILSRGLCKTFHSEDKNITAIYDCNINIKQGERVALSGGRDSGKTTLLRMLGGLERPSNGRLYINDMDISQVDEDELAVLRRETIGCLLQYNSIISELTVHENIIMPAILANRRYDKSYYEELIYRLKLTDYLSQYPKQLSSNQLYLVACARALINQPDIILMDKPENHIFPWVKDLVMDVLLKLVLNNRNILIMVTDDSEVSYLNHLIKLKNGVVIEDTLLESYTIA